MFFLLTIVPILALIALLWRERPSWNRFRAASTALLLFAVLFFFHHADLTTGLDVQCYRAMARAFASGRGYFDPDTALASVPEKLRKPFFFRPSRPSRDMCFRVRKGDPACGTEPLFTPALPLAASFLGRFTPTKPGELRGTYGEDAFMPLLGALWAMVLLLFPGQRQSTEAQTEPDRGFRDMTLPVVALLFLATPLPFWFLRGFHADVAGATLASMALCGILASPMSDSATRTPAILPICGFLLGLAVAYHVTMVLPALPILLFAILRDGVPRRTISLLGGFAVGLLPALYFALFVCFPYVNLGDSASVLNLFRKFPEVRAMGAVVVAGTAFGTASLVLAHRPAIRSRFESESASRLWTRLFAAALAALALLPFLAFRGHLPKALVKGFVSIGVLPLAGLLLLVGISVAVFFFRSTRNRSLRLLLLLTALTSVYFVYLKGTETPVGMWSFRRLFPIAAMWIPICAEGLLRLTGRPMPRPVGMAMVLLVVFLVTVKCPGATTWLWPTDRGTARLLAPFAEEIGTADLMVFDYYPHATPFMRDSNARVFGLAQGQESKWGTVAAWLGTEAATNRVLVGTSFDPVPMEESFSFEPVRSAKGSLRRQKSKRLYDERTDGQDLRLMLCRARPFDEEGRPLLQRKIFDGGPIGLRGHWKGANRGGIVACTNDLALIVPRPRSDEILRVHLEVSNCGEPASFGFAAKGLAAQSAFVSTNGPAAIELSFPGGAADRAPYTTRLSLPPGLSFHSALAVIEPAAGIDPVSEP